MATALTALAPHAHRVDALVPEALHLTPKCCGKAMRLKSPGVSLGEIHAGLRRVNTEKIEDCVQFPCVYGICPVQQK